MSNAKGPLDSQSHVDSTVVIDESEAAQDPVINDKASSVSRSRSVSKEAASPAPVNSCDSVEQKDSHSPSNALNIVEREKLSQPRPESQVEPEYPEIKSLDDFKNNLLSLFVGSNYDEDVYPWLNDVFDKIRITHFKKQQANGIDIDWINEDDEMDYRMAKWFTITSAMQARYDFFGVCFSVS